VLLGRCSRRLVGGSGVVGVGVGGHGPAFGVDRVGGLAGALAQPGDEAGFGSDAGSSGAVVGVAELGGGVEHADVLQAGQSDQLSVGGGDDLLGHGLGQHQVGVSVGLGRRRGHPFGGAGGRGVQRFAHRAQPFAVGRPPQPGHHQRFVEVDLREVAQEPGQHRGVEVGGVPGEAGADGGGDPGQRGQRDPDTAQRPGAALGAGAAHQMCPHLVAGASGAVAAQQHLTQLVERHPPSRQPGELPAVDRYRVGAGHQQPERPPRGVQRGHRELTAPDPFGPPASTWRRAPAWTLTRRPGCGCGRGHRAGHRAGHRGARCAVARGAHLGAGSGVLAGRAVPHARVVTEARRGRAPLAILTGILGGARAPVVAAGHHG
jgi:hypothetical protein